MTGFIWFHVVSPIFSIRVIDGFDPSKNMSSSDWIIIPTIGENKNHVPNYQPVLYWFPTFGE